jgi:Flp pilus assembly secretin CpaC
MSARSRLASQFLTALKEDFNQFGSQAIALLRRRKPEVYLQLVADLLPKEANIKLEAVLEDSWERDSDSADASRKIELGLNNENVTVELPGAAREAMVSDPDTVDAVLQTATRCYLVGKRPGEANVSFNDRNGVHLATVEVTIKLDPWSRA